MKRLFAIAALSCPFVIAQATSLGLAAEFNAFVFDSAHVVGAESEGAVAVRNNFTSDQAFNFAAHSTVANVPTNSTNIGLYVGGEVKVANGQLHAAKVQTGNAIVSSQFAANNVLVQNGNLNPGGTAFDPNVFTDAYNHLTALSNALAGLNAVNYVLNDVNNPDVNLAANNLNGALKVFNITTADLAQLGTLNAVNFTGAETVVFNVYGATPSMNRNWQEKSTAFGNLTNRTLWNFVDATTITNQRQLNGTVLAPDALFHQGELVEGSLLVNQWTQTAAREIHPLLFDGDLEAVPEPMTLGTLALLALLRKRKQAKKA